jgi:hypothetical protein
MKFARETPTLRLFGLKPIAREMRFGNREVELSRYCRRI